MARGPHARKWATCGMCQQIDRIWDRVPCARADAGDAWRAVPPLLIARSAHIRTQPVDVGCAEPHACSGIGSVLSLPSRPRCNRPPAPQVAPVHSQRSSQTDDISLSRHPADRTGRRGAGSADTYCAVRPQMEDREAAKLRTACPQRSVAATVERLRTLTRPKSNFEARVSSEAILRLLQ